MWFSKKQSFISWQKNARITVWLPALAVTGFMGIYLPLASALVQQILPAQPATAAAASITPILATGAQTVTTQSVNKPTTTPNLPTLPACTTLSFGMPSQLLLDNATAGLTVQLDAPTLYQIYGRNATDIRTQIQHCAPGSHGSALAEYTAQTSYSLVWQYNVHTESTACTVNTVKVGLHTAMALPSWQPSADSVTGLASRWQSFMSALVNHEQGHVAIDKQYAAKIVSDINSIGALNCASVTATVNGIINNDVSALNAANSTYDQQTNHGATQGANLPTY